MRKCRELDQQKVQDAIDEIMDNFDFNSAWKMLQVNSDFWIHRAKDYENLEPEVRVFCRGLLKNTIKAAASSIVYSEVIETGGFECECAINARSDIKITLRFIGVSWDVI
jgi:hypothetical protein